jgi:hypothetical protein
MELPSALACHLSQEVWSILILNILAGRPRVKGTRQAMRKE